MERLIRGWGAIFKAWLAFCSALVLVSLIAGLMRSASGSTVPPAPELRVGSVQSWKLYFPGISREAIVGLSVNPSEREVSRQFFNSIYRASEGVPANWTGDRASCDEGSTSREFRDAVQLRANYYRAMAGVPGTVVFSEDYTEKAQKAALMLSENKALSHNPPSWWRCYSVEGAEGCGSSCISLGVNGWDAVDGYMRDAGGYSVGHRRWILYPQTREMGTGDMPAEGDYPASNALWVFDSNLSGARPQTREEYVAWPPPGYVPYPVVFSLWSFSYDEADFSSASVAMVSGGKSVPLTVYPAVNGFGENTLVWQLGVDFGTRPASDTAYWVTVSNVLIDSSPRTFVYRVIVFDPEVFISGEADAMLGLQAAYFTELP